MRIVREPNQLPRAIRRVCVVGTSGCGKSTFARTLAARTGVPHTELDGLHWKDDWTEATDAEFRAAFEAATRAGRWILDGNYRGGGGADGLQDQVFAEADLVVWLDLPFHTLMRRITLRSVRRAATREPLWGTNNHESFGLLLTSKYSMPLWVAKTFRSRRRQYAPLESPDVHPDTALLRIRSPRDVVRWSDAIARVWSDDAPADGASGPRSHS